MNAIAPGTPCFLVHLVERKELNGCVVEVVGPVPTPDGERGAWYQHASAWAREMFPGHETIAPRENLRPIVPPELAPAQKRRTPEVVKP